MEVLTKAGGITVEIKGLSEGAAAALAVVLSEVRVKNPNSALVELQELADNLSDQWDLPTGDYDVTVARGTISLEYVGEDNN